MCGTLTWNSPQTCSVSMYYGLRLISLSLFIVCCHSWLSDLQFCKRTSCQIHKCVIYLRKKIVTRKSVKLCWELLNSRNSNLKSYQITFVLIAIEQVWKLTRGNISSIKNCLQLKHLYCLSGHVPQNDWHTVLALFCITTAYQTQLVHGSHRSAYDPEKFSKAWEIAESLFGKKSEILEKIQRIWMTLKWTEAIFTYDLWKTY